MPSGYVLQLGLSADTGFGNFSKYYTNPVQNGGGRYSFLFVLYRSARMGFQRKKEKGAIRNAFILRREKKRG